MNPPDQPTPETVRYADYVLNHYSGDSQADKICLARDLEKRGWTPTPTPTLAPTPRTDAAYFATGATMYSLAGEMKLIERELAGACSLNALACRKWDAAETKLAAAKAECERLKALGSWMHTCLNHTDAERKAGVGCWCCATARASCAAR